MGATQPRLAFHHDLLLYGSDREFVDTVVPFLCEGVASAEGVVVCCRPRTAGLVRGELGEDARITYLDYEDTYNTPIGAIAVYQQLVDGFLAAGHGRVRVIAEAAYDRTTDERLEWARYEAVANRAMESYPVSAICLYDTRQVPADLLGCARSTHPRFITGTQHLANPDYVSPAEFLRKTTRVDADPVEVDPPDLEVAKVADLDELRLQLELTLLRTTHMAPHAADLVLAVNEVATNAIRYGRPPVGVCVWVRPDRCVCTVTDGGAGVRDPFAGYIWPGALSKLLPTHGMGLWLARRLCQRVDIIDGAHGCTVRLIIHRGSPPARSSTTEVPAT